MFCFVSFPSRFTTLLLAGLLGIPLSGGGSSAVAQVPQMLHYQAVLAESEETLDGPVDLTVSFFADSTGGQPLADWEETRTDVPVTNGRISLLLGSQTPLPDTLFSEPTLYLQLTVNGVSFPRTRVTSTAYALRARVAEGVAPGSLSANALADGAVTTSALARGAVTTDGLADGSVTAAALADAAVARAKLAPDAVTTDALADGSVTSTKLGPSAVVGSVLAEGAVTTSKLANGAVTASKIATGGLVSSLNDLTDAVRLVGGDNVSVEPSEDDGTITISIDDDDGFPSSRRWKTNVQSLDGLALVKQLRGVRYEWIESGKSDVGLIAEEVGAVVPEVVTYASNGVDAESVEYAKLVALLIEAVKEQQAQIEADRARLDALQDRIEALEQKSRTMNASDPNSTP